MIYIFTSLAFPVAPKATPLRCSLAFYNQKSALLHTQVSPRTNIVVMSKVSAVHLATPFCLVIRSAASDMLTLLTAGIYKL